MVCLGCTLRIVFQECALMVKQVYPLHISSRFPVVGSITAIRIAARRRRIKCGISVPDRFAVLVHNVMPGFQPLYVCKGNIQLVKMLLVDFPGQGFLPEQKTSAGNPVMKGETVNLSFCILKKQFL